MYYNGEFVHGPSWWIGDLRGQDYLDDRYRIGQALKRHPGLAGKLELPSWYDQDWWASKTNMAVLWELLHQCQNWSYLIEEWREKDHMGEWLHSARVEMEDLVVFAENQEKAKQLEESGQKGESAQATSGLGSDAQPARDDARRGPTGPQAVPFPKGFGRSACKRRRRRGRTGPQAVPFRLEISVTTLSTTHPLGPTGSAPIERSLWVRLLCVGFRVFSWRSRGARGCGGGCRLWGLC